MEATLDRALRALQPTQTHREVSTVLRRQGWSSCGAGDWAFALLSPAGDCVARISPFDPVGPFTARLYEQARETGRVPLLWHHRRLVGGGDLQLMERLTAVPEEEAIDFLKRLATAAGDLAALAVTVARIHRAACRRLPWCGPLDDNPSNVMRNPEGRLVLTDPYYADGPNLYAMAHNDPHTFVTLVREDERRYMTEIPLACSGPWPDSDRAALRESLRRADGEWAAVDGNP